MSLHKDLIFLMLQLCDEHNLKRTTHMLEQETGYFFNLPYIEKLILDGEWEEVESYISSFTNIDNMYTYRMYLEIRKQKYLEALDRHDYSGSVRILHSELKVFSQSTIGKDIYEELRMLLNLPDEEEDTTTLVSRKQNLMVGRNKLIHELRPIIHANPDLQRVIVFPEMDKSRLKFLINQSLSWQHYQCANPHPQFDISTLFVDHKCPTQNRLDSSHSPPTTVSPPKLINHFDEEMARIQSKQLAPGSYFQSHKLGLGNANSIIEVSHPRSVLLVTEVKNSVIWRLVYTVNGNILALAGDGTLLLWRRLQNSNNNLVSEVTVNCASQLWQSSKEPLMIKSCDGNMKGVASGSFTLSENGSYVVSASGNMITLYCLLKFEKVTDFRLPPRVGATHLLFYPPDNNIIAVGMNNSTILIYNLLEEKVVHELLGHSTCISGLAFSSTLNVLISSAIDTEIVLWDCVHWTKKKNVVIDINMHDYWCTFMTSYLSIELDMDEKHFLAVQENKLSICETETLQCLKQWNVKNYHTTDTWISDASFSCDAKLIFAVLRNGTIVILGASDLIPRSNIDLYAYLTPRPREAYPVVVAANRQNPNQIALGFSSGEVIIIEP